MAAPTAAGAWLALAALGLFLARHPLRIAADDVRHGRRVPRTRVAWGVALAYLLAAVAALAIASASTPHAFWPALALAALPASVQLAFDATGRGRNLTPELAGAKALGGVAGAAGLAAGLGWLVALALWASALVRVLPAIVTVRERVQRLHGQVPGWRRPVAAHVTALGVAAALAGVGVAPWGVLVVAVLLAVRAARDLRTGAPPVPAMRMGVRELATGLLAATAIGLSWRAGV